MNEAQHIAVCALSRELNEKNPMDAYDESTVILHDLLNCSSYYMGDSE